LSFFLKISFKGLFWEIPGQSSFFSLKLFRRDFYSRDLLGIAGNLLFLPKFLEILDLVFLSKFWVLNKRIFGKNFLEEGTGLKGGKEFPVSQFLSIKAL